MLQKKKLCYVTIIIRRRSNVRYCYVTFNCGVAGELIQIFGDWASDAYKAYLEISLPAYVKVAKQMKLSLLQFT